MEYRIRETKEFLKRLGSNFKAAHVGKITKAMAQFKCINDNLARDLKARVMSTKHKNPNRKRDLHLLVTFIGDLQLFKKIPGRNTRNLNIPPSIFNAIDKKELEDWSKINEKICNTNYCSSLNYIGNKTNFSNFFDPFHF